MSHRAKTILVMLTIFLVETGVAYWSRLSDSASEAEYPLIIRDDAGRTVEMQFEPKRIVSLSPGNTEILFALDLGERVVGVTDHCDYPAEARDKPKVGGFATVNVERVVSLEPDIVFATGGVQMQLANRLENLGFKTVVLSPRTVEGILRDIELVGRITNANQQASTLVRRLRGRIEFVRSATRTVLSRPRVYYEIWHSPLMSAGKGTWIDELIELAGGSNIFSDSSDPYPIINSELVIERDPEIIVIKRGYMGGVAEEDIIRRPGWSRISAVKTGRIYEVEENILIRPGPRIVDGLEALARLIHPQFFA